MCYIHYDNEEQVMDAAAQLWLEGIVQGYYFEKRNSVTHIFKSHIPPAAVQVAKINGMSQASESLMKAYVASLDSVLLYVLMVEVKCVVWYQCE